LGARDSRCRDELAARFWPGPLTLVLRRAPGVGDELTRRRDTIGLRIPGHPIALELLRQFGEGIAAPSANRFGRISPTTAEHVRNDLGEEVDLILDGGPCEIASNRRSSICRAVARSCCDRDKSAPGILPRRLAPHPSRAIEAPRAPRAHWNPITRRKKPLRLVAGWTNGKRGAGQKLAQCCVSARDRPARSCAMWIRASADPQRYARDSVFQLRALDASGCDEILVEEPPASADGPRCGTGSLAPARLESPDLAIYASAPERAIALRAWRPSRGV